MTHCQLQVAISLWKLLAWEQFCLSSSAKQIKITPLLTATYFTTDEGSTKLLKRLVFKESLWLVISAREPSRTSFFNKLYILYRYV